MTICMQEELTELLESVGKIAQDPAGGITRLLYSKEWLDSQLFLKERMEASGLDTSFDAVGNLYGKLAAATPTQETILTGSHVDTVRGGGKYDGMFGIVAGIVALRRLREQYGAPLRNIEVVSFAEEEGSRFPTVFWGSKNMLGLADIGEAAEIKDANGLSLVSEMHARGFAFPKDPIARKQANAFIELHVEQGNVLEREHKQIGVVDSIAGQRRYTIELHGTANHAGTTPMHYRKDAFHGACKMICWILDEAKRIGAPLVATAGFLELVPNVVNVIPGAVKFSLDIRHTDSADLEAFTVGAEERMAEIARNFDLEISIDRWMDEPPVPMDGALVECLKRVCDSMDADFRVMHSGAGHDAQLIAKYIPGAMIFVPSSAGISHNPQEYTDPADLEEGLRVLMETLYELAYKK